MIGTRIVPAVDDDFAALVARAATLPSGWRVPPEGLDDVAVVAHVREIARVVGGGGSTGAWLIVAGNELVGLCGYKAAPSPSGDVEIGYNVAPARRRLGHATRAVAAIVTYAECDPRVRELRAEVAVGNAASERVLAANGFERVGTRYGRDEGELSLWSRPADATKRSLT